MTPIPKLAEVSLKLWTLKMDLNCFEKTNCTNLKGKFLRLLASLF